MDKMTAKQAVEILRDKNISLVDVGGRYKLHAMEFSVAEKIAALIERQEADAAAMLRHMLEYNDAIRNEQCVPIKTISAIERIAQDHTTAGAALLEVVRAAEKANALLKIYAETGAIPNGGEQEGNWACICAVYDSLDAALEAYKKREG